MTEDLDDEIDDCCPPTFGLSTTCRGANDARG